MKRRASGDGKDVGQGGWELKATNVMAVTRSRETIVFSARTIFPAHLTTSRRVARVHHDDPSLRFAHELVNAGVCCTQIGRHRKRDRPKTRDGGRRDWKWEETASWKGNGGGWGHQITVRACHCRCLVHSDGQRQGWG